MAPHNISLVNQLHELYDRKLKLEDKITINKDIQDSLDEKIEDNCWHLSNIPLRRELIHPATDEYRKLQKQEEKLRKSCEEAKKNIEELKTENIKLKRHVDQLENEITRLKG